MVEERETPETISKEELTHILAEATGSTPEEIEEGAEEFEVAPPWEADVEELE